MMEDTGAEDDDIAFPESEWYLTVFQVVRVAHGHDDLNRRMPVRRIVFNLYIVIDAKVCVFPVINGFMCAVQILNHNRLASREKFAVCCAERTVQRGSKL